MTDRLEKPVFVKLAAQEKFYLDLENKRKTSARNSFFGKIDKILRILDGTIDSEVVVQISDSTALCAVLAEKKPSILATGEGR
jgi:molybdopterin-binding protein